jgi:dTDP-4-dehydrorhamnose reductase
MPLPDETALERALSQPTPRAVAALAALDGDLLVLGAGGKMGPSLARMARRARADAGGRGRVVAVARFSTPGVRDALERDGVHTLGADLLDRDQVAGLPDAAAVVHMVGQKFGTATDAARTWAINTLVPAFAAERFRRVPMVAFSTGNVYPLWPAASEGPSERDPVGPIGEYAQSALARERILEYQSARDRTPMALLRLNYAVEPRYGVLRDLADRVTAERPIDLTMGWVNLIWQADANAAALAAIAHVTAPPLVLNLTGPKYRVRWLTEALGRRLDRTPTFVGVEAETALLSDATAATTLLGPPAVDIETMLDRVAAWVRAGGRSLGRPTHFEERAGSF